MKKIINRTLALFFATVALTSCLKDDTTVLDPEKAGPNLVEFQNVAEIAVHGSTTPLYLMSFPILPTPTPITLTVSYSGAELVAPKDITVNIALAAQSVLDQYNTEQKKNIQMMPSAWYTVSASSVVIPKGQKTASFTLNVNTSLLDLLQEFAVPLKLTSNDATVSTNFGTALFQVGAKNPYDGLYNYKTSAITSLVPNANRNNIQLVTTGPNTVAIRPGLLATYSNAVSYEVNPTTNGVRVTCPSLGVQEPQDARSNWNPATKTLTVFWKQGNGGRTFEETFTYLGPR